MADAVDRFLRSMEARFDAQLGIDERIAAADLALSLLQDQTLRDLAPRGGGWNAEGDDGSLVVGVVGADFVADRRGNTYRMSRDVVLIESETNAAPRSFEGSLLDALRSRTRDGISVRVSLAGHRVVAGILERVGRDHLVIQGPQGRAIVPEGAIRSVSCGRGD